MRTGSHASVGIACGLLAFVVRLAVALATGGLRHPELFEYDSAARALIGGQGFVYWHIGVPYFAYMAPLHSWLGAASYWMAGSVLPLMLLQCASGAVLAAAAAAIAARLCSDTVAPVVAGLLVALHPGLVVYSATKAHPLVFDALFFTLTLLCALRLRERASIARAAALGAVVGLGALSRGTIVIFLPITALWLIATSPKGSRAASARLATVAFLVAAAVIAPWTIRTSLRYHRFVFILTTDAEDFWRGNNPYATGHSYVDSEHIVLTSIPPEELAELERQPDELSQAQWFSDHARAFIRANPGAFVRLTVTKFFQFWWFAGQTGVRYPRLFLVAYEAYYLTIMIAALAGAVAVWRSSPVFRQAGLLLLAFLLVLSGLQSLYYVEGRHRWAVEPMLLAAGAVGVARVVRRVTPNREQPSRAR